MFPSLRLKLIVAFVAVTFLTVVMSAAGMLLLLRQREVQSARERVGRNANAVAEQVQSRVAAGWPPDQLSQFLRLRADELKVRFLLIDQRGVVVTDTADALTNQPADQLMHEGGQIERDRLAGFTFTTYQGQIVFQARAAPVAQIVAQQYRVLMLVPQSDIAQAWRDLLPRVALSGGIALIVAVLVGTVLARSITRPVAVVTHASEEMARGVYAQQIPARGHDEIGRLAGAFNTMASRVSRSHQAMRDLLGNVAHELKTPLTSIQGYSQALLDGMVTTPEEQARVARIINDEAERMRRLVEDLLYLSRLESGQLVIERAPVRIPALLHTAVERARPRLAGSTKQLRLQLPVDLPTVMGDEGRLDQVLGNLLDNAARHTPDGGTITVSAQWSPGGVTVRVHNSGSYIPPEHIGRIFERFYQADPSRTRDGHRGGLGLAIAREIVAAHGGALTATSDPDTGTEFQVVLPASVRDGGDGTSDTTGHVGEAAPAMAEPAGIGDT